MRQIIRKFLSFFGYDFIKIDRQPLFKKDDTVQVGNYSIKMPGENPLLRVYAKKNDFNSELGRIVSEVQQKYPNLNVIDIGANAGDTASLIKSINSNIPLVCIEGDITTFGYLEENIKQFNDIKIYNKYLGERAEEMTVTIEKKGWNSTVLQNSNGNSKISLTTLDILLKENLQKEIEKFKLVKIDTEGFDTIILRGSLDYLRQSNPVIYFEYNRENMQAINEDGLSTLRTLKEIGYAHALFFDDRGRYILNTNLNESTLIENLHDYANGKDGLIYYYNICLIHKNDHDIAQNLAAKESAFRLKLNSLTLIYVLIYLTLT